MCEGVGAGSMRVCVCSVLVLESVYAVAPPLPSLSPSLAHIPLSLSPTTQTPCRISMVIGGERAVIKGHWGGAGTRAGGERVGLEA